MTLPYGQIRWCPAGGRQPPCSGAEHGIIPCVRDIALFLPLGGALDIGAGNWYAKKKTQ